MIRSIIACSLLLFAISCNSGSTKGMTDEEIANYICECSTELVAFNLDILENSRNFSREEMMVKMEEAKPLHTAMMQCLKENLANASISVDRNPQIMVKLKTQCPDIPRNIADQILNDIHSMNEAAN